MDGPFHEGELELQRRAGVLDDSRAVGRIVGASVPAGASRFLAGQRLAVASSVGTGGAVWASVLTGPAGFVRVVDDRLLHLAARPRPGDPLGENLASGPHLGLLVLDLRTRQRLRFNGRGLLAPEGIFLAVDQAYGNCRKYIQRRDAEPDGESGGPGTTRLGERLTPDQQAWFRRADTLFVASFHPEAGADASHRGGFPGFVRVLGPDRLAFDDYAGNGMFNTLGNLLAYPHAGLLLADFETGDLLQVSGRAEVRPDFSVHLEVASVRETPRGTPLRSRFVEYSPVLPGSSHGSDGPPHLHPHPLPHSAGGRDA